MLLPFHGDTYIQHLPKAMPWAKGLLAFQAVGSEKTISSHVGQIIYGQTYLCCTTKSRY